MLCIPQELIKILLFKLPGMNNTKEKNRPNYEPNKIGASTAAGAIQSFNKRLQKQAAIRRDVTRPTEKIKPHRLTELTSGNC